MSAAVADVIATPYLGSLRRLFLESKATEVVSSAFHALTQSDSLAVGRASRQVEGNIALELHGPQPIVRWHLFGHIGVPYLLNVISNFRVGCAGSEMRSGYSFQGLAALGVVCLSRDTLPAHGGAGEIATIGGVARQKESVIGCQPRSTGKSIGSLNFSHVKANVSF